MAMDLTHAASLAAAMIALRDESSRSVCAATNIKPANLSVWLRGKEQVISQKRVAALLCYLDVVGGTLARGKIHRWYVYENLDDLKQVLDTFFTKEQKAKSVLCSDGKETFPYTRVLGVWGDEGWFWISLSIHPGISTAPVLRCDDIAFGHEYVLPLDLETLPFNDPERFEKKMLLALAESKAGLSVFELSKIDSESSALEALQHTLRKLLENGIAPEEINLVLLRSFQKTNIV